LTGDDKGKLEPDDKKSGVDLVCIKPMKKTTLDSVISSIEKICDQNKKTIVSKFAMPKS